MMRNSVAASMLITTLIAGCADMTPTQRGTATGAGIGAGVVAVLVNITGNGQGGRTATGAVLGGAAGAAIGNIWSRHKEKQKRQMQHATQGTGVQVTQTPDKQHKHDKPNDKTFDVNRSDIKPNF